MRLHMLMQLAELRYCFVAAAKNISVTVVPPFLPNYVIDGFGGFNPYGLRRKVNILSSLLLPGHVPFGGRSCHPPREASRC